MKFAITLLALLSINAYSSQSGSNGIEGRTGNNGRNGNAILAVGCEDFSLKTIINMSSSYDASAWSTTKDFICNQKSLSKEVIAKISAILDSKISNVIESGYINRYSRFENLRLEDKVSYFGNLLKEVELNKKSDLGCYDSRIGEEERKSKVCFSSEIDYINTDGTVETKLTYEVFLDDNAYRHYEESVVILGKPTFCSTGQPIYEVEQNRTSNGQPFFEKVKSTCEELVYTSDLYRNLNIKY